MKSSESTFCCGSVHAKRVDCPAWKFNCHSCGIKGHFKSMCRLTKMNQSQQQHTQHPKGVQEVQTHESDQNTGNTKDVDIVNMIRSVDLHEQCEAKKDSQLCHHLNVQELCIQHEPTITECQKPMFVAPVNTQDTKVVWENCEENVIELEICVATPTLSKSPVNVITIHDVN